jgi:hypothetical protein
MTLLRGEVGLLIIVRLQTLIECGRPEGKILNPEVAKNGLAKIAEGLGCEVRQGDCRSLGLGRTGERACPHVGMGDACECILR